MIWDLARRLHAAGVLGINRRNADYMLVYNERRRYPLVDDKVQTKRLAQSAGIAVPELYGVIEIERQVRDFSTLIGDRSDFVIKPARGSGGNGVLIVSGRHDGEFARINGQSLSVAQLEHHLFNTLSGLYSLGGNPDVAMVEYRVDPDPVFAAISYLGVPDVRIVVFLGVPVMAMVRLPTRASGGKANLHQGAIGAGIDLASGKTLTAVWRNDIIAQHPDTGGPAGGVQVPRWDELLLLAARCTDLTGLGYIGVDVVLDRERGPLMLEINARPRLNVQ
ncbi:MAG: alpha-L-glutamate ligase, partial [Gammaproteobacteria bacterium SG8_47]